MNENENMNPDFNDDSRNNEYTVEENEAISYQPPQTPQVQDDAIGESVAPNTDFEPVKSIMQDYVSSDEGENAQSLFDAVEQVKNESFNPYAPKNQQEEASSFNQQFSYNEEAQQVNPSYTQPFDQSTSYNSGDPYSQSNPYAQNTNPYTQNANPYGQNSNTYGQFYQPPKKQGGKTAAIIVVAVCVFVAVIALISSALGSSKQTVENQPSTTLPAQSVPATSQNVTVSTTQPTTNVVNSVWVADKVRPSVVGVLAYQQGELAGEGSGVLMSEDLTKNCTYVVTCAHVIDEANCDFSILLLDGTSYEAEVVAHDVRTDIGVLKVNKTGLPLAEFGDSSTLKVGEPIYAIGNPGGSEYFGSITNGIVASIDRSISATYTMTCIQHNAAINPGNSGGALVNSAGQVIGINSSKIARTDFEGMGFAVPSSIFTTVVDALIQYGYVPNRPELGIKYASLNDYQLYSIIVSIKGLPKGSVIIAEIPEGSALSGTNAQVGDLITAVNGKKMDSVDVLLDLIDTGAVGDTLTLTLCRIQNRSYETTTFDVTVKLVENKGSVTTTTQPATLPEQDEFGDFEDFFGDFFGW